VQYGINIYSAATEWSNHNSSLRVGVKLGSKRGQLHS